MSSDPIESAAKGAIKGALEFGADQVKAIAKRFQRNELIFAEDPEVIALAKKQRLTAEFTLLKEYTAERDLHILFQMGITLRKLERQKERVESLRHKILTKFGAKGLHTAQLVQNGFFNKYLVSALERSQTIQQLRIEIKELLDNIENTVVFTKESDDADFVAQAIIIKLLANNPKTFIICASGYAKTTFKDIVDMMLKWISTGALKYEYEMYISKNKEAFFLNKSELMLS